MKALVRLVFGVLLSFCMTGAHAADPLRPGLYVSSGDGGRLKVEQRDGQTFFSIDAVGENCHICGLSGRLVGTVAETVDEEPSNGTMACRIRMTPSRDGRQIDVQPQTEEACRRYCGLRAGFDGVYRKPGALCTDRGQRNARDLFIRHYRAKNYARAVEVLRPLLEQCGDFLHWLDIDGIRNDLSLAYFHMGKAGQCIDTLRATRASGFADEDALREALPTCDFDNYVQTARATWHNMRLCGAAPGAGR